MALLRLVPYGRPAVQALRDAIVEGKGGDALAPVTVAVPSNYAGLSLRRMLGAGELSLSAVSGRDGVANVRFLVLARVAELLGATALASEGRRPLTGPVRAEAVRAALAADAGVFGDVADHAATERSLDQTFRELRPASAAALDTLVGRSDRAGHVVRLFRDFRTRTDAYYDEEELALAAAAAVREGTPALRDVGHVVLYLPRRISPGEQQLLAALAGVHGLTAILGLTGYEEADAPARRLALMLEGALGTADEAANSGPPVGTAVVAVTDAEEEVRTALRLIMERLDAGTPLHRMALLYPIAQPYALLAHEQMRSAGLPHNGPSVRTLAQTMSGRTLVGLLRLKETDFRRDALMDWLSAAPVLERRNGRPAPAHRWDTLSRAAGIVSGVTHWQERLGRYRASLQGRLDGLGRRDEGERWQETRLERDMDHADRLRAFIDELASAVEPGRRATWGGFAAWGGELLDRYLGGEGHRAEWPSEEIEAHRRIEEALASLSALGELREQTDESTFRRALERELEAPSSRIGRFGAGVFAGRIGDALGTDFDAVFVVGMSEGVMPPRTRNDPLVPDRERAGLEDDLPPRAERRAEDRRDYLAALASAPERTLIFPRADLRGQRGRLPAQWLLETASALEGKLLFSTDLEETARPWLDTFASFEAALKDGHAVASEQEYDLRSLLRWRANARDVLDHYLSSETRSLRDGLAADRARHGDALTRWDGLVPGAGLAPSAERAVSPSALQHYAACPFRYLLGHVLYVAETERPEATLRLSPLERGNLLHRALETFVREARPRRTPDTPWSETERARLLAIGEQLCDEVEASGLTGKRLLWRMDRARIMRDLAGFLDEDEDMRAELGVVPAEVELSFGMRGTEQPPLTIDVDGAAVAFRGRIDRVDASPDGERLMVLDYKTGAYKESGLDKDPVKRGQALQLPIYGLAAQRRSDAQEVAAYYWYTSEQANYERRGYPLDDRRIGRFNEAMGVIVDGIGRGAFPARPGKRGERTFENCLLCPYDRLCAIDSERERAWKRKRDAQELERYVELAEADD